MTKKIPLDDEFSTWLRDVPEKPGVNPLTDALDQLYARGPEQDALSRAQSNLKKALDHELERAVYFARFHLKREDQGVAAHPLLGRLFLAMSDRGLVAIDFGLREHEFLRQLTEAGTYPIPSRKQTAVAVRQLGEYLEGSRLTFDLPLDLRRVTDFQRQVLQAAAGVPRGQVTTYGEIARQIGKPNAARAVGQALGRNPVPIVIPCHRVIAADGSLRGYSGGGGIRSKAKLLQLEGVHLPAFN